MRAASARLADCADPVKAPAKRTRLRRMQEKADYGLDTISAILDAQPLAHIGHMVDGFPVVTPTLQWRQGDRVYWHGSSASRMIKASAGQNVCLSVTLLDGLVLARSGLEHSVNFRSVMVFGVAEQITDPDAKARHLKVMIEQMYPGRWAQLRPMTAQELKATAVLSLPLTAASAKIGQGMPTDPPEDLNWPVWAGVIPLRQVMDPPQPDGAALGPLSRVQRF